MSRVWPLSLNTQKLSVDSIWWFSFNFFLTITWNMASRPCCCSFRSEGLRWTSFLHLPTDESHEWTREPRMSRESNKTLSDTLDFTAHGNGGHASQWDQQPNQSKLTAGSTHLRPFTGHVFFCYIHTLSFNWENFFSKVIFFNFLHQFSSSLNCDDRITHTHRKTEWLALCLQRLA